MVKRARPGRVLSDGPSKIMPGRGPRMNRFFRGHFMICHTNPLHKVPICSQLNAASIGQLIGAEHERFLIALGILGQVAVDAKGESVTLRPPSISSCAVTARVEASISLLIVSVVAVCDLHSDHQGGRYS